MEIKTLILEALADALPLDFELHFYHISTPPTPSCALYSAAPGQNEEKTFCESHFIAASLPATGALREELLIFAIEVLVYTTQTLTTIFVSKADSTGYFHFTNTPPGSPSIIRLICTTVLSCLVKERLHGPRLVLSLFARSQNQYLFPGSIENPGKHVLDDRQLIKWWCRTLHPVLQNYGLVTATGGLGSSSNTTSEGYIIVPGCDRLEARAFFPPSGPLEPTSRWSNSYPRDLIVPYSSGPPRCLIPRFPDDPKARFLDDLDSEIPDSDSSGTGKWRSVKSLDQFWEMMSYRQECSAGRLVGFIWLVFTPPPHARDLDTSATNGHRDYESQLGHVTKQLPTPNQSQINSLDPVLPPVASDDDVLKFVRAATPPASSPPLLSTDEADEPLRVIRDEVPQQGIEEKQAPQSGVDIQKQPEDLFYDDVHATPVRWPLASRGNLILSEQKYNVLMDHLLQSDFANQDLGAQSTLSWISKASELAGSSIWGQRAIGRHPIIPTMQSNGAQIKSNVNVLTGIRKKRKLNDSVIGATEVAATVASNEGVSMPEAVSLPMDLIRRKRKGINEC